MSGDSAAWLVEHGWIQSRDGTWGYPNSTARNLKTETAFALGQIIAELDDEEQPA